MLRKRQLISSRLGLGKLLLARQCVLPNHWAREASYACTMLIRIIQSFLAWGKPILEVQGVVMCAVLSAKQAAVCGSKQANSVAGEGMCMMLLQCQQEFLAWGKVIPYGCRAPFLMSAPRLVGQNFLTWLNFRCPFEGCSRQPHLQTAEVFTLVYWLIYWRGRGNFALPLTECLTELIKKERGDG